jgi:hypothetical protein
VLGQRRSPFSGQVSFVRSASYGPLPRALWSNFSYVIIVLHHYNGYNIYAVPSGFELP